jgi:hypothetical protein
MKDVGIVYGELVYFMVIRYLCFVTIRYSLWSFGISFPFWYAVPRKIWQRFLERFVPAKRIDSLYATVWRACYLESRQIREPGCGNKTLIRNF